MIAALRPWILRRRLWPASLGGQLIALLLLALLASHVIVSSFFVGERRMAVRAALAGEAVSRTATVALLLENTPAPQQDSVLEAASTPLARFRLAEDSALDRMPDAMTSDALRARLIAALDEMSDANWARRVQVAIADGRAWRPPSYRSDSPLPRHGHAHLMATVQLTDGRWLTLTTHIRGPRLQWAWPALLSMFVAAAAIVVVVTLTVGRMTRPLRDLAAAADRFGRGARGERVTEVGPSEARRLVAAFNEMQARLSRFVTDRTQLLAAISHDLRTPITAMRLRAELIEDEATKAKLVDGLDEIHRMAEATLTFAKEEAAEEPLRPVDLAALVDSIVDDFAEMGADVRVAETAAAVVDCRVVALRRALRNLIDNAVRYGHRARLSIASHGDTVTVDVDDDGPGLPADKIDAMFEPFVRLDASRNRETGGVGLGLPIARTVLRAHGGDVILRNRSEGGLRASMILPRHI
ncbi:MAG: ATP-binding protein [Pseudomonadota bacterium]